MDPAGIAAAPELEIAAQRPAGDFRAYVPIWAVTVGDQVYVRTWYRRDTGWYGAALASGRARIRLFGAEAEVTVTAAGPETRAAVDAAYRAKYGDAAAASMVTDAAAVTTLRLGQVVMRSS